MKKLAICGHFGLGKTLLNGQTVKTKIVTEALEERFGSENIKKIDTHGGKLQIVKSVLAAVGAMFTCQNLAIFPAHNGVRVFGPVLSLVRRFSRCKLHYVVIGGWLPKMLGSNPSLTRALKKFDGIYVETSTVKRALDALGFENIVVMPNCKKLTVLSADVLATAYEAPYKLCTFSRVMQEKGIADAVDAVASVNEVLGYQAFCLDIYGQVEADQTQWFEELQSKFPAYVRYCGCVASDRSVEVLQNYFALLFPTRFYTEGVPGTIIDAYAAGVPVVSARWESYHDVVDDNITGVSYEIENVDALRALLLEIVKNPDIVVAKKKACIEKALEFTPEYALRAFVERL